VSIFVIGADKMEVSAGVSVELSPDDAVVVGGPSTLSSWGFDLVRAITEIGSTAAKIHIVDRFDIVGEAGKTKGERKICLCNYPSLSSLAGLLGMPDCPAYAGSKAAIRIYGHGLRRLLAPHGVQVTIVLPGFIDTPMSRSLPYTPPVLWSAERSAAYICRALTRGRQEVAFPWQVNLVARATRVLPIALADRILARLRAGA